MTAAVPDIKQTDVDRHRALEIPHRSIDLFATDDHGRVASDDLGDVLVKTACIRAIDKEELLRFVPVQDVEGVIDLLERLDVAPADIFTGFGDEPGDAVLFVHRNRERQYRVLAEE